MKISLFLSGSDSTVLCVLLPEGRVMTLNLENQIVVVCDVLLSELESALYCDSSSS